MQEEFSDYDLNLWGLALTCNKVSSVKPVQPCQYRGLQQHTYIWHKSHCKIQTHRGLEFSIEEATTPWFKVYNMTTMKNGHLPQSQVKRQRAVFLQHQQVCKEERKPWCRVPGFITLGYISKESLKLTIGILKLKTIVLLILHKYLFVKESLVSLFQFAKNRTQCSSALMGKGVINIREFDFKCSFLLKWQSTPEYFRTFSCLIISINTHKPFLLNKSKERQLEDK